MKKKIMSRYPLLISFMLSFSICKGQKDSVSMRAEIEISDTNLNKQIVLKIQLTSLLKSKISFIPAQGGSELICGLTGTKLYTEVLDQNCYREFEFHCDPTMSDFVAKKEFYLNHNEIFSSKFDLSNFFTRGKGSYRIKIYQLFNAFGKQMKSESEWIYINSF